MKILTVVGTRPEIIRLSEVIKELDRHADHVLVHTGQNYDYELNEIFFKDLGLRKPDYMLGVAGATPAAAVAAVIEKTDEVLAKEKPDALLVLGDTNSALAVYPAKRRKIPIFHMEAGNRCRDMRVPEEVNRRIVDHTADINMPYSEHSRTNLLSEGLFSDRVIKTGSPLAEVLTAHQTEIQQSSILETLGLKPHEYFVLSAHREENVDDVAHLERLASILKSLGETYNLPIIFSVHPRTRKRLDESGITLPPQVREMKPFGFFDYIKLEKEARCVLSDSGTIQEESSILDFPAVQLREAHERLESADETNVITAGLNPERVLQAVSIAVAHKATGERVFSIPEDYRPLNVSKKVLRIIIGYTDYVNRVVWSKPS
jgi:UDP-N-acetylglucosamine 2-epimerase (non-hydrolysing)